jgi:hypothetical protein
MIRTALVGIGAGIAAALLFLAPIGGSSLALPLFIVTGLPIAIAGLGWGVIAALAAAAAGAVVVGIALAPTAALVFLAIFGAPVAWLARLAGLSRTADRQDPKAGVEWYPLGRLLLHATLAVAIGLTVAGFALGYDPRSVAAAAAEAMAEFLAAGPAAAPPPTADRLQPFVDLYVALLPFTSAMFVVAVVVFNLWLGARIVRLSGRSARPAERLWTVAPQNEILAGFLVAAPLAFLPGAPGIVAGVFAGAFGCALVMIGLAVLHALTLGTGSRVVVLVVTYVLIVFSGLPLLLFALLGAGESFLHLRARRFRGAPPT